MKKIKLSFLLFITIVAIINVISYDVGYLSGKHKGYNMALDTCISMMEKQLRADSTTVTNIVFDDTLSYYLYHKQ